MRKHAAGPEPDEPDGAAGDLRERLERAQADDRRAQALLDSVASMMVLPDAASVMRCAAELAILHLGFSEVSVYAADHELGVLTQVARLGRDPASPGMHLPGLDPLVDRPAETDPIPLRPGHALAEFALGNLACRVLAQDPPDGPSDPGLMVQMRTPERGVHAGGMLLGVMIAHSEETPAPRQVSLLRSLATMAGAATEAARMEQFRQQILSSVSHELRTPLAAIRAYNELLLDEDAGPINDEQRLFLERIETTSMQLDRMVEDLLDLSKLRAAEMAIARGPVDVVAVIEHIMDTLSPEARRRSISLTDEIAAELPQILSNSDRLAQVLFNLVGNAVKYVPDGGSVLVRAAVCRPGTCSQLERIRERSSDPRLQGDGECVVIEVIDDGPGIATDELGRVFEEFFRGRLTDRSTKGSGLGLAISSRLTRLLGGALEVDSTPGEGSVFYLILPIEAIGPEEGSPQT